MARITLTDERIKAFTCPPGKAQAFLWDAQQPGLAVRVTPAAKAGERRGKSFIFQARYQGGDVRITIGDAGDWPLNSATDKPGKGGTVLKLGAREKARQYQQEIDGGRDPRQVKAERTAADVAAREDRKRAEATVGEAWTAYLADRKPHWGARHYADHEALAHPGGADKKKRGGAGKTVAGPLWELMGEKLPNLDADRLETWATKEAAARGARARLGLRLVRAFLGWCSTHKDYRDVVQADAAKSKRIREKLGDAERRKVVLQKEELAGWFAAVRAIPNPCISVYLQLMLLNGPRPNEPLALQWLDINFARRIIRIRDKITGHREIPMTPYTGYLLQGLPRRNQWVFSSPTSASGCLVDPADAHDAACDFAELPRITLQGLRRSFATLSEWVDIPAGVAAQIQGHAPQGVREQNYVRRPLDLLRMHHEKLEAWILEQAGVSFDAEAQGLRVVAGKGAA